MVNQDQIQCPLTYPYVGNVKIEANPQEQVKFSTKMWLVTSQVTRAIQYGTQQAFKGCGYTR